MNLYVQEHDFELPWLWDVNCGNSYISLAVVKLHLLISSSHYRQLSLYLVEYCLEEIEKHSEDKIQDRLGHSFSSH